VGDHDTLQILLLPTDKSAVEEDPASAKSVYLLPSRKMYSTRKTRFSSERTIVNKN
jgi:hypothetical protein